MKAQYDFVICGSGSSGSVVARRLAENSHAEVLLIEAGGVENIEAVSDVSKWPTNLGSERSWRYISAPNPNLNNRTMMVDAGKILGGGSSINVMTWAQGHPSDWDFFASESGNAAWNSDSVGAIYREIEDWQGMPDPEFRGKGGPVYVEPASDPSPLALAMLEACVSLGMPDFPGHNGRMMRSGGGCALVESCLHKGERRSIFRQYVYPVAARSNLTIVTGTQVTRVLFERTRAVGVEVLHQGSPVQVRAAREVVLCLGAIQSPKILMQSGIGDSDELNRLGIDVEMHLPGVGRNYQDHVAMDITWELREPLRPRNAMCEALLFWKRNPALTGPDIQGVQVEVPLASVENSRLYKIPQNGWGFFGGTCGLRAGASCVLPARNRMILLKSMAMNSPNQMI